MHKLKALSFRNLKKADIWAAFVMHAHLAFNPILAQTMHIHVNGRPTFLAAKNVLQRNWTAATRKRPSNQQMIMKKNTEQDGGKKIASKKPKTDRDKKSSAKPIEQIGNMLDDFRKARNYDELKRLVNSYAKDMEDIEVRPQSTIHSELFDVDEIARDLLPEDIPDRRLPVRVGADGNCLPRCGSVHAFGSEDHHDEIRARIVIELTKNEDIYLNSRHLAKGTSLNDHDATKLPGCFAAYSPEYTAGDPVTEDAIRRIYQQEVLHISRKNAFMGIWELFALASILKCRLFSVYPVRGNPSVRQDLHRQIYPNGDPLHEDVYIMWTITRGKLRARHWVPNHFVPLLAVQAQVSRIECSFSDEDEDETMDTRTSGLHMLESVGEVSELLLFWLLNRWTTTIDLLFIQLTVLSRCRNWRDQWKKK